MKKLKTRNEWVGCSGKCRFYGDTIEATSYGHWTFVKKINGKVFFNDYTYSNTTSKHQWEMRHFLKERGIKIDYIVYFRESLNEYSLKEHGLKSFYAAAIQKIVQNNTKRVRNTTKQYNINCIKELKNDIKELREFGVELSFREILSYYRYDKRSRDNKEDFMKNSKDLIGKIFRNKANQRLRVTGRNTRDQTIEFEYIDKNCNGTCGFSSFNNNYIYCQLSNAMVA